MLAKALQSASNTGVQYVDDVFSTYLYTGNGSTQTITNGIDLAGKGGMVWFKGRSGSGGTWNHALFDTSRGASVALSSNLTNGNISWNNSVSSFGSSGFTLGSDTAGVTNTSANNYASWTFRKAPKFFDVVTYTGTGGTQTVNHSLGIAPGLVIAKRTDSASDWIVFHRSITTDNGQLNSTAAFGVNSAIGISSVTATNITLNSAASATPQANVNGATYVAYLFAHDTATDGLIQCGSASLDVNQSANVTLGWEPQFVLVKLSSTTSDWRIVDTMRGMTMDAASSGRLLANSSAAETTGLAASFAGTTTATGFNINFGGAGAQTAIYIAIRRPNKPPTSGTQVYNAVARTGTGAAATVTGVGFAPDFDITGDRSSGTRQGAFFDRLRGADVRLASYATAAETSGQSELTAFGMDGASFGTSTGAWTNVSATTYINYFFRRAPGFFDEVCHTGTGANLTLSHGLTVAPELVITKKRSAINEWYVTHSFTGTGYKRSFLEQTAAATDHLYSANFVYTAQPTASSLFFTGNANVNESTATFVHYLFASLPGISKVGSYTGNGSSQTINCGFTGGARFVLIKRTDSTGDWYVWDTARGIVSGNDPHLSLNSTAAEVTTNDSIDPDNSGFVVNQLAATNINVSSATYIFLAIA